jgi:hypothetical protein
VSRPLPTVRAESAPLEVREDGEAFGYVRATELLRLARARRDARKQAEGDINQAKNHPDTANVGAIYDNEQREVLAKIYYPALSAKSK